jgi:hypothetical protein
VQVLLGLALGARTASLASRGAPAAGVVVQLVRSSNGFLPVVEFATTDGQAVRFTEQGIARNPPGYQVGEAVPIRYSPSDPKLARIWNPRKLAITYGGLVALGAVLVAVGASGVFG